MRILYSFIWYLILPLVLLRLLILSIKHPGYMERFWQRLGFIPSSDAEESIIWLHAVSVGEVIATKTIVEILKLKRPNNKIVITTGTPTGAQTVERLFGKSVRHYYQPYDPGLIVKHFLKKLKPEILIVMETELWPNLFHYCNKNSVPVVLANARMSERSAMRYLRCKRLAHEMLSNVAAICCQTQLDAERLVMLGADNDSISVTGSVKFDIRVDEDIKEKAQQIISTELVNRKSWIAASTHPGEEQLVIETHQQLLDQFPDCLLVLAPRHAVRSAEITKLIASYSINYVTRSSEQKIGDDCQILLLDTMGELILFYAVADIAFVGGSLVEHGGHNPIEPAYFSKPILFGPHDINFSEINMALIEGEAAIRANDQTDLLKHLIELFSDPKKAGSLGNNACRFIGESKGATEKVWNIIEGFLD